MDVEQAHREEGAAWNVEQQHASWMSEQAPQPALAEHQVYLNLKSCCGQGCKSINSTQLGLQID